MTANKKKITFDFNEAVKRARQDFPEETKNVEFIDLSLPNAHEDLRQWIRSVGPRNESGIFSDLLNKLSDRNSSFCYRDPISGQGVLVKHPKDFKCLSQDRNEDAYFNFNHELGHLVVPEAMPPDNATEEIYRLTESIADTFAAISCIKQEVLDGQDIETIAEKRAFDAWMQQALCPKDANIYMTSYALDCVSNNYSKKELTSLTPKELVILARDHGTKHKTTPEYALKCLERGAKKEAPPAP